MYVIYALDLVGTRLHFAREPGVYAEIHLACLFQKFVTSLAFYSCLVHD